MLRWVTAAVVGLIGSLLVTTAVVAVWADRTVLDTEGYVDAVAPLAREPEVQDLVAERVSRAIDARLDRVPVGELGLPPVVEELARTARAAAGRYVATTTRAFVRSDRFEEVWRTVNRAAHTELMTTLLREDAADGALRLDLGAVVGVVVQRLSDGGLTVVDDLPPITVRIEVGDPERFHQARAVARLVDGGSIWVVLLAVVAVALALLLAATRLRALAWVGLGVVLLLVLLRLGVWRARGIVGDEVPTRVASRDVVDLYYDHVTSGLREGIWVVGIAALVAAVAGLVASVLLARRG